MQTEKTILPTMEEPTEVQDVGEDNDDFLTGLYDDEPENADEHDEDEDQEDLEEEEPEDDTSEEEEQPEEQPEEAQDDKPAPQGFKVKYNGEEKELTYEEAVTYAQKGMNYDHVASQLAERKRDPGRALIEQMAREAGLGYDDYVTQLQTSLDQKNVSKLVAGGMDEEEAKRAVADAKELHNSREELQELRTTKARRDRYIAFAQSHPDVDLQKLPPEVLAAADKGDGAMDAAYTAHQNQNIQQELEAMRLKLAQYEQAEKNKKTSAGSAKGAPPKKKGDTDPFLEGLYSPY